MLSQITINQQLITISIQLRRAYDSVEKADGSKVLLERLWLRGVSQKEFRYDYLLKDLAPSDELRQWFDHDPKEFRHQYQEELNGNDHLQELLSLCKHEQESNAPACS